MSETQNETKVRACAVCGKPVIDNGTGNIAHESGGVTTQKCQNCGWMGGQYGRYTQCPRCGDETSLVDDHNAS